MIEFACRCSHHFSLPQDQAGGVIQCPSCHHLVDIPTLSDLEHIDADGNYKIDDGIIPLAEPDRIEKLTRAFTRRHEDAQGEIDLRPTMHDVMQAGTEDLPYELADEIAPAPPKYDPVTGELIRPLDVKPDDRPHHHGPIPVAQRAVEYASGSTAQGHGVLRVGLRLIDPVNLFVMSIILFVHVLFQPVNLMMMAGIFLVAPLCIMGVMFIFAHYGCVVEEMGPAERDELPRPLRDASLSEDIWRPFVNVTGAGLLCFGPALAAARVGAPEWGLVLLNLLGTFFYPAVLLTLSTSGTSVNLRPDRLLGVIRACGVSYWIASGLFFGAYLLYALGLWRLFIDSALMFMPRSQAGMGGQIPWWFEPWIAYPALVSGVFLMHWFCWGLGLLYRAHHPEFPWVLQKHMPTRLHDRTQLPGRPAPAADRRGNANSQSVKQRMSS